MTRASEIERLRRCRETFALATARGLSMEDARRELVRARWAEADGQLAAKRCGTVVEPVHGPAFIDAPWMMRD